MDTLQEALHELRQRPVIHEVKKLTKTKNCNEDYGGKVDTRLLNMTSGEFKSKLKKANYDKVDDFLGDSNPIVKDFLQTIEKYIEDGAHAAEREHESDDYCFWDDWDTNMYLVPEILSDFYNDGKDNTTLRDFLDEQIADFNNGDYYYGDPIPYYGTVEENCKNCNKETDKQAVEECDKKPANFIDEDLTDIDDAEYLQSAKDYAKEIASFDLDKVNDIEADYNFANHGLADEAEQIIYHALQARKAALTEKCNEDVASSMPVTPLPTNQVKDFILSLPTPTPRVPPKFFKLGYIKELGSEIPSKFRGGRGSEGQPRVRIFKCTEYSALYTGSDWKGTNATKAADKVLGSERHTGEKTGFNFGGDNSVENRIGVYRDGSEALQAYIADQSKQKVKFFISLNDEDLHEASKEEVSQYLTPAVAARVLNPVRPAAGVDANGEVVYDKPINRFKLTNIYMIGNLGHSVM